MLKVQSLTKIIVIMVFEITEQHYCSQPPWKRGVSPSVGTDSPSLWSNTIFPIHIPSTSLLIKVMAV